MVNNYDIMVIVRHDLMGSFPLQMAVHGLSMRVTNHFPQKKHQPQITKQVQNQTKHVNVRNTKKLEHAFVGRNKNGQRSPPQKNAKAKGAKGFVPVQPVTLKIIP